MAKVNTLGGAAVVVLWRLTFFFGCGVVLLFFCTGTETNVLTKCAGGPGVSGLLTQQDQRCDYWNAEGKGTYNAFTPPKGWGI